MMGCRRGHPALKNWRDTRAIGILGGATHKYYVTAKN